MKNRVLAWFKGNLPTRKSIAQNRWLKPFAHHLMRPDLWHLNRRSVPRAVALGLFVAPIVPVAHTFVAALLAIPTRANIVIAAAVTWLINPFTMPPFYYGAYLIGSALLKLDELSPVPQASHDPTHKATEWASWLVAKSGPAALGTIVMATIIAALGYMVTALAWRIRIGRKWRTRHNKVRVKV
jgi:uncharacterized protein (DUF2062 family)